MPIEGVETGVGLEGGGTTGYINVEMAPPVSLANGGTGVSAINNNGLLTSIGAMPRAGGSMSGNLTVAGGIVAGNATGLTIDPGTLIANKNDAPVHPFAAGLQVAGEDGQPERLLVDAFGANAVVAMRRAQGTGAAITALTTGNALGQIQFYGSITGSFSTTMGGLINCAASEPWDGTANGTTLNFFTTAPGAIGTTQRVSIGLGVTVGNPTGGDKGVGSLNVQSLYVQDTPISPGGSSFDGGTITNPLVINYAAAGTALSVTNTGGDPMSVNAPGGQNARILFHIDGTTALPTTPQEWRAGCNSNGDFVIRDVTGTANPLMIYHGTGLVSITGDLELNGTALPSDRRVKKNIEPWLDCGLEAIKQLNPISFEYNGLGGIRADGQVRIGLDADEAAEVIPEMARVSQKVVDGRRVKGIAPGVLMFALVNAVRELGERLEKLEARRR